MVMYTARRLSTASLTLALLIGVTVLAIAARGHVTDAANPPLSTWPSFQMTYVEEGHFRGLSQPVARQTWSLSYRGERDWEKTLIASTVNPGAVGDVYRFQAGAFIVDQVTIKDDVVRQHGDEVVMPEGWLIPDRQISLINKGFVRLPEQGRNRLLFQREDHIKCQPDENDMITGISQPVSCGTSAAYTMLETIVYRTDVAPPFPVELVTEIEGDVVSRITVTTLTTVQADGTERTLIPSS